MNELTSQTRLPAATGISRHFLTVMLGLTLCCIIFLPDGWAGELSPTTPRVLKSPKAQAAAETGTATGRIRVALYDGGGSSSRGISNVFRLLDGAPNFAVTRVTPEQIGGDALKNFDVVIFTGGSGSRQANTLGAEARNKVTEFVERGGGYVGICAGAYLATSGYDWSLKLINAKTVSPKWQRGKSPVKMELTGKGREIFGANTALVEVRYANGPIIQPAGQKELPAYEPLAFFRSEVAENGSPAGVMINSPAIVSAVCGKGRVDRKSTRLNSSHRT